MLCELVFREIRVYGKRERDCVCVCVCVRARARVKVMYLCIFFNLLVYIFALFAPIL